MLEATQQTVLTQLIKYTNRSSSRTHIRVYDGIVHALTKKQLFQELHDCHNDLHYFGFLKYIYVQYVGGAIQLVQRINCSTELRGLLYIIIDMQPCMQLLCMCLVDGCEHRQTSSWWMDTASQFVFSGANKNHTMPAIIGIVWGDTETKSNYTCACFQILQI